MTSFLDKLKTAEPEEVASFKHAVQELADNAQEGSRNEALNKLAFRGGVMIAEDKCTEYWVYEVLTEASNENSYALDYGDDEVQRIIAAGILAGVESVPLRPNENPIKDLILTSADLQNLPPIEWLLDGVLMSNSLAFIVGAPGLGKSFMALDLIGCVANRKHWKGHSIGQNKPGLYIVAEGASGIKDRVASWEAHYGTAMSNVSFLPTAIPQSSAAWASLVSYVKEEQPGMIVIDTLARMAIGLEENSASDMGKFIRGLDDLREASDGCILTVHHSSKAGGTRGSSALDGAADTIYRMYDDENGKLGVYLAKSKESESKDLGTFKLKSVGTSAVFVEYGPVPWETGEREDR